MLEIISHYYLNKKVRDISNRVSGTTNLYRYVFKKTPSKILFCGVLYMAEDLFSLSDGTTEVYLPEIKIYNNKIIQPRCPMEINFQPNNFEKVISEKFSLILSYVNMSALIKARSNGVYNGTEAIRIINNLQNTEKVKIGLIGDKNVNWWIKQNTRKTHPDSNIIPTTPNLLCPPHNGINSKEIIDLWNSKSDQNEFNLLLHSESNRDLLKLGLKNNIYIGGTTGMIDIITNSKNSNWIVPTIDTFVDYLKQISVKKIYSPNLSCHAMNYVNQDKVLFAKKIIENEGEVAKIILSEEKQDYKIDILKNKFIRVLGKSIYIPAVKLLIEESISKNLRNNLLNIVNYN